ncbi:hypothetical protein [Vibrio metschnikovii]|uniref:hypothetical protein n=1 Tax=Vibrio metschnikovii TaxID=28172 RepID=UPI00165EBBD3|nr:hypothetical protein [Vibrio metschnikovii]
MSNNTVGQARKPALNHSDFVELVVEQAAIYSGERHDQIRARMAEQMLGSGTDNPFDFSRKVEGVH